MKKKIIVIFLIMATLPYSYYLVKYRKANPYSNVLNLYGCRDIENTALGISSKKYG
ncbi:MAG: hypothetical protein MTP17_03970 [Candidatus Midichloria sp.]|nr:MAG: hypothetical protein MTP17_03970 [Candidatus Midichloria sp.]